MANIREKLMIIQSELKVPKGQKNSFGGYKYRSCEDILESVKPLLKENKMILTINDDVIVLGDRFYVKATATITDIEKENEFISNSAFARESLTKKGMDDSQITGTASSYARKYALNGLLAIDDTKDADTDEYSKQEKSKKTVSTDDEQLKQESMLFTSLTKDLTETYKTDVRSDAFNKYVEEKTKIKNHRDISKLSLAQLKLINECYKIIIVQKQGGKH